MAGESNILGMPAKASKHVTGTNQTYMFQMSKSCTKCVMHKNVVSRLARYSNGETKNSIQNHVCSKLAWKAQRRTLVGTCPQKAW